MMRLGLQNTVPRFGAQNPFVPFKPMPFEGGMGGPGKGMPRFSPRLPMPLGAGGYGGPKGRPMPGMDPRKRRMMQMNPFQGPQFNPLVRPY